jgi:glutathionylspermidine synthase
MRRIPTSPRDGWRARVERAGFPIHTADGPYWDESVFYELSAAEVDGLEAAADELHARCLDAVQHVLDERLYARLGIPDAAIPMIERSWNALDGAGEPSIYGRLDLAYGGDGPPKLLEYNADTPTALFEAAVVQWTWLQDVAPRDDQFNAIHERLVAGWRDLRPYLRSPLFFSCLDVPEDVLTASYLQDTAAQAGLETRFIEIREVGWDERHRRFVDLEEKLIGSIFKLYPWEWMLAEPFGRGLPDAATQWIEPPWKMILSCKGILPILWELFPDHPNLLPAWLDEHGMPSYARKPLHGREGANVTLVEDGRVVEEGPDQGYSTEGWVYQALAPANAFDGRTPVIGAWLVQGKAAGIGIREADGLVTDDTSRFVPHLLR